MDRLLARLDRRFGRYAIQGLPTVLVGGMAILFVLWFLRPGIFGMCELAPRAVLAGQAWRLVTFVFIPEISAGWGLEMLVFLTFLNIYWIWIIASNLESEWGAFKFNVYFGIGVLGAIAAAFISGGSEGNLYLYIGLLFAMATLFPDYEIRWFGILPITMRWVGWLSFAYVAYRFVTGDFVTRAAVVASLANYLLFFWGDIVRIARGRRTLAVQASRRASTSLPPAAAQARTCAVCGARESDGADIRVCSCEKCREANGGASRTLCLEHARSH